MANYIIHMIFSLLFSLFFSLSAEAHYCVSTFKNPSVAKLRPFLRPRVTFKAHDLEVAGSIIYSKKQAQLFARNMKKRSGTYPLIITNQGIVVISHRLPDNQSLETQPFLATHRGLYSKLKREVPNPSIVFAGHLRIIGGHPERLIDQANTFHDTLKELGNLQVLISSNQERLDATRKYLLQIGLINKKTRMINFSKKFGGDPKSLDFDGHATDTDLARFELMCRGMAKCWKLYLKYESMVQFVMKNGGKEFFDFKMDKATKSSEKDLIHIGVFGSMLKDGVIDTFLSSSYFSLSPKITAGHQRQIEQFQYFLNHFDHFFKTNLK